MSDATSPADRSSGVRVKDRDRSRSPASGSRLPVATLVIFIATAIATALQGEHSRLLLSALERTPAAITEHQWWRFLTPLFLNPEGWKQVCVNFTSLLVLGTLVERILGSWKWLLVYFVSGIVGNVAGLLWQPVGAGSSVAIAGLLGSVAAWLLLRIRTAGSRTGAVVLLAGGVALVALRDLHGPPLLCGALLGSLLLLRSAAAELQPDS